MGIQEGVKVERYPLLSEKPQGTVPFALAEKYLEA
jgi:hypothetical protein